MANRIIEVENQRGYNATMKKIDALMKKGENNLTDQEAEQLRILALSAQAYEKNVYTITAPQTLEGLIELRMYEKKLTDGFH